MIDNKTRGMLETLYLPPIDVIVPDVNILDPTDDEDIAYNAACNERIKERLAAITIRNEAALADPATVERLTDAGVIAAYERPMIRTHYPADDFESEDIVSLDENGEIVVLDAGER